MKNGADVFRGGPTDILTTNERGIYPSAVPSQRFVTEKYRCRSPVNFLLPSRATLPLLHLT